MNIFRDRKYMGRSIYIGINDNGEVVGVTDCKKLLEDIPNKIKDTMGIIADVNCLDKNGSTISRL